MRLILTGKTPVLLILCICALCLGAPLHAQNPTASFTTNVTSGCAPLSVSFTNTSGQANSYLWYFGNGNTSTLPNPSMVYATQGTYTVSLVAINTLSNKRDSVSLSITVVPDPVAGFTASPLT